MKLTSSSIWVSLLQLVALACGAEVIGDVDFAVDTAFRGVTAASFKAAAVLYEGIRFMTKLSA